MVIKLHACEDISTVNWMFFCTVLNLVKNAWSFFTGVRPNYHQNACWKDAYSLNAVLHVHVSQKRNMPKSRVVVQLHVYNLKTKSKHFALCHTHFLTHPLTCPTHFLLLPLLICLLWARGTCRLQVHTLVSLKLAAF